MGQYCTAFAVTKEEDPRLRRVVRCEQSYRTGLLCKYYLEEHLGYKIGTRIKTPPCIAGYGDLGLYEDNTECTLLTPAKYVWMILRVRADAAKDGVELYDDAMCDWLTSLSYDHAACFDICLVEEE